ncbi:MAG: cytochrome B6 [Gammaproteobacteria bacterium]|nr:cytochrome B6 [Gammaproteobacteria bacterium]
MRNNITKTLLLIIILITLPHAYSETRPASIPTTSFYSAPPKTGITSNEPIKPIPNNSNVNADKVALGQRLFEDKNLSSDGSKACRSCHHLDKGGADGEQFSPSIDGGYRVRNTPSIYNVSLLALYGWYGLPGNLENIAETIIRSKKGLATEWSAVIKTLNKDQEYLKLFDVAYSDGIKPDNIKNAIAEYMRSLTTPNSRFDQYLRGNLQAISAAEKEGYRLFKQYGCTSCHQGVAVGGNMVAPFNLFKNYLNQDVTQQQLELGRINNTKDESDKYVFRVPSLRNVALTSPYFHDGSATRLETAVDIMGRYMLGRVIPTNDRKLIVRFLHTLTGNYQGQPL